MNGLMNFIENKVTPPLAKFAELRYMRAIRQGLIVTIPLLIIGSFFLLFYNLDGMIPALEEAAWFQDLKPALVLPFRTTVYAMSLFAAFGIGGALGKEYKMDPVAAGVLSTVVFLMTIPAVNIAGSSDEAKAALETLGVTGGWYLPMANLGGAGMFGCFLTSIVSIEIFRFMRDRNMVIKMPEQVPEAVANSFAALFPMAIGMFIFWFLTSVIGFNIHEFFMNLFAPLQSFLTGESLLGVLVIIFLTGLLWSVGIHGMSVVGSIARPFWQIAFEENAAAIAEGTQAANIAPEPFYQWFVWIGGAGATLALLIACLMFAKSAYIKDISKLSIIPGIFNINEPVIFGFPIVMNPLIAIPFILIPMILGTIAYIATVVGIVPETFIMAPWTMPAPIGAWMATGGSMAAVVLTLINLVIAILIYIPFVRVYDKQLLAKEQGNG